MHFKIVKLLNMKVPVMFEVQGRAQGYMRTIYSSALHIIDMTKK